MFQYVLAAYFAALATVALLVGPHRRWPYLAAAWAPLWAARAIEVLIYSQHLPGEMEEAARFLMAASVALTVVWVGTAWSSRARPAERAGGLRRVCLAVGVAHLGLVTYYALPVGYVLSPLGANLVADGALTLVTMGLTALYAHRTGRSWIAWWIASFFAHGLPAVVLGFMPGDDGD